MHSPLFITFYHRGKNVQRAIIEKDVRSILVSYNPSMKLFRLFPQENAVGCLPDTAVLPTQMPFFVPDFTRYPVAVPCVFVHIIKLGKAIGEKFARRYYDSQALRPAFHFLDAEGLKDARSNTLPWSEATAFDGTVALASADCPPIMANTRLTLMRRETAAREFAGKTLPAWKELANLIVDEMQLNDILSTFDALITRVSLRFTLRQGDVLLLPVHIAEAQPVSPEQTLGMRISTGGKQPSDFICRLK